MCGRFALTLPPQAVRAWFVYETAADFPPRFNIAPGQPILMVRRTAGRSERQADLVRWGFSPNLPGRSARPPAFLINARAETVHEKPSFRAAFRRRRCLIPADAFYEWRHGPGQSRGQPFLFRSADGQLLALAALWETWTGPNGEEVDTACIITTAANDTTSVVHPRLPALIPRECFDVWLDTDEARAGDAYALLRPASPDSLTFAPIGETINKTANDGPDVQDEAVETETPLPAQGSLF